MNHPNPSFEYVSGKILENMGNVHALQVYALVVFPHRSGLPGPGEVMVRWVSDAVKHLLIHQIRLCKTGEPSRKVSAGSVSLWWRWWCLKHGDMSKSDKAELKARWLVLTAQAHKMTQEDTKLVRSFDGANPKLNLVQFCCKFWYLLISGSFNWKRWIKRFILTCQCHLLHGHPFQRRSKLSEFVLTQNSLFHQIANLHGANSALPTLLKMTCRMMPHEALKKCSGLLLLLPTGVCWPGRNWSS